MRVEVYFNLHRKLWSVRDLSTGLVVDHVDVGRGQAAEGHLDRTEEVSSKNTDLFSTS